MKTLTPYGLLALVITGCSSPDLTSPDLAQDSTQTPSMPMTLLARIERSPTNVVSFYDSEIGIVIGETGRAEEAGRHGSLEELRKQGMKGAFRALSKDENAEVPNELLQAESRWQERHAAQLVNPA